MMQLIRLWKCPDCGADMKDWRNSTAKDELDKTKPFECTGFRCGKRFSETEIMGLLNGKEE